MRSQNAAFTDKGEQGDVWGCRAWGRGGVSASGGWKPGMLLTTGFRTAPTTEMELAPEACHPGAKKALLAEGLCLPPPLLLLEKPASATRGWVLESLTFMIFSLLGVQGLQFFQ